MKEKQELPFLSFSAGGRTMKACPADVMTAGSKGNGLTSKTKRYSQISPIQN